MNRPQYLYEVDGERKAGTLHEYAKDCKNGHYAGVDVTGIQDLYDRPVSLDISRKTWDDWMTVHLSVGDDHASYVIDLRA